MKRAILIALILCLTMPCTTPATTPAVAPSPPESYIDAPYKKLGSEAFVEDYDGKLLHFKAMFAGEWTLTNVYEMIGGISTRDRVFINHRDVSYVAQETGLGSPDVAFPPFALSVPKSKSDLVYELSRGDVFEVWGRAEKMKLPGKIGLHVSADRVARVATTPTPALKPAVAPSPPGVAPSPPESYVDAPYKKLGSEAFVEDYDGKLLHFKAMFVGEWTLTNVYEMIGGISTRDRVFINHRDVSYVAQETGLGSPDVAFPPFALSVPKSKSDLVYELSRGDVFEVWGRAEKMNLPGKTGLHVSADRVARDAQKLK